MGEGDGAYNGTKAMNSSPRSDVTELLLAWNTGDRTALERLMPLVYQELRRLAGGYMRSENPGHSLQATALVNEAYIRLVDQQRVDWKNRYPPISRADCKLPAYVNTAQVTLNN